VEIIFNPHIKSEIKTLWDQSIKINLKFNYTLILLTLLSLGYIYIKVIAYLS